MFKWEEVKRSVAAVVVVVSASVVGDEICVCFQCIIIIISVGVCVFVYACEQCV